MEIDTQELKRRNSIITKNVGVSIGLVIFLCMTVAGTVWKVATFSEDIKSSIKMEMDKGFLKIDESLKQINQTMGEQARQINMLEFNMSDRWTGQNMKIFAMLLKQLNINIPVNVPDVDDIRRQ